MCLAALGVAGAVPASDGQAVQIRVAARAVRPGEVVVLTVATAAPAEQVTVRALGRDVPAFRVDATTWQALLGLDLAIAPGSYRVAVAAKSAGAEQHAEVTLAVVPRVFSTRRLQVNPAFVNPPVEAEAQILRDAADLARVWTLSAPERLWSGPFVRPVPGHEAGRFGARSVFNGQARAPHGGEDFSGATGTPVLAPNAGRVVVARSLYFTGNTIVIDHGLGVFSLLAHLSKMEAGEGDTVIAGQEVGLVGATGRVTGPHLHWATRIGNARVDPLSLLAVLGPS